MSSLKRGARHRVLTEPVPRWSGTTLATGELTARKCDGVLKRGRPDPGVNLVGYFDAGSGLREFAESVGKGLDLVGKNGL